MIEKSRIKVARQKIDPGESKKSQGDSDIEAFYKKNLSSVLPKKEKTEKDRYFIASLYKRLRDYKKAGQWYRRVLESDQGKPLHPGACFHLGEMAFFVQKYDEARIYFEKTLALAPGHRKAADYLMVIQNKKR